MRGHSGLLVFLAGFALAGAACNDQAVIPQQELVVYAAASLRGPFETLARTFEHEHATVRVVFNFAGSQQLRTQLEHGAAADVFASADEEHVTSLERTRIARAAATFARNTLVVVTPRNANARIQRFTDLPNAERIVIGVPEVPIGKYTRAVFDNASKSDPEFATQVMSRVISQELNVKQVLSKVLLGEADAAVVYKSDVIGHESELRVIAIPESLNVVANYRMAVLSHSKQSALAAEWVALILAEPGQLALQHAGFLPAS